MNTRPIINIRHQLRWHRRLYSDASTLALWSAWLWLCRPAILGAIGMVGMAFGRRHPALGTPAANALPSFEEMALLLIGVSALLLLWNRLSREPAVRPRVEPLPDFERHFGLTADQITAAREGQRCVVHHDDQGRIVTIESAAPVGDPRPADSEPAFRAAA
ncbi:MAG TPA: poly-beta-1,6-N-acetyl-D-glucosamine biosynthesis protein PgaD [Steroidobacteraceae bacterium]|nr:poly-beta-1,6-N-acetyl-D-glucosamine biosynthesis protein PgaD [Steroidobacteraceae bacterium]